MAMPPIVVLIACKVVFSPVQDPNAAFTGLEKYSWQIEHGMMHCRRHEIQMYDPAVGQGADAQPFNQQHCQRSALMLGVNYDQSHKSSNYRTYKVACPVPTVNQNGDIIAWTLPDCGDRSTIVCENDTAI